MRSVLILAALLLLPATAAADVTAFLGVNTTPSARQVRGAAGGFGLLIVAFEFEFSDTVEDERDGAPGLRTGMGNVLLQTPVPLAGLQFYATAGAGAYRETLGTRQETHVGTNAGGGVKVSLLGPVKARLDYRVFNLRGGPLHSTVHRVYAGLNIGF